MNQDQPGGKTSTIMNNITVVLSMERIQLFVYCQMLDKKKGGDDPEKKTNCLCRDITLVWGTNQKCLARYLAIPSVQLRATSW